MNGILNEEALQGAFYDVVEKHETLRTIFPNVLGSSYQKILDMENLNLEMIITNTSKAQLETVLVEAVRYNFNLDVEPAVRLQLFTVSENEHVILILLHHIVGDGWSLQPLTRDFAAAYKARCQGNRVQLETLPVQYADYALWQQQLLGDETTQESLISTQLDFWKKS